MSHDNVMQKFWRQTGTSIWQQKVKQKVQKMPKTKNYKLIRLSFFPGEYPSNYFQYNEIERELCWKNKSGSVDSLKRSDSNVSISCLRSFQ